MSRANLDHFVDELEELVSDVDPQGDPGRLAPGPAGMEPPGDLAEALDEEALAGVVGLTELRVVGEVLDGHLLHLEQQPQQVTGGRCRDDLASQQVQHVCDVGEVQTLVEEGCVGVLQGEPAVDQLLGGPGLRWAAAPHRWRHDAASCQGSERCGHAPGVPEHGRSLGVGGQQRPEQGHGLRSVVVIEQQPLVFQRQP